MTRQNPVSGSHIYFTYPRADRNATPFFPDQAVQAVSDRLTRYVELVGRTTTVDLAQIRRLADQWLENYEPGQSSSEPLAEAPSQSYEAASSNRSFK